MRSATEFEGEEKEEEGRKNVPPFKRKLIPRLSGHKKEIGARLANRSNWKLDKRDAALIFPFSLAPTSAPPLHLPPIPNFLRGATLEKA